MRSPLWHLQPVAGPLVLSPTPRETPSLLKNSGVSWKKAGDLAQLYVIPFLDRWEASEVLRPTRILGILRVM